MVGRWHFLVVVVVSVFAFAATAQAAPVFLSAIDISDAGQDGFEPQVEIDSSGNVHAVWTRSDGTNLPDPVLHAYAVRRLERSGEHLRPGPGRLGAAARRRPVGQPARGVDAAPTARTSASRQPSSPRPGASAHRSRSPTRASTPFEPQVDFDNTGKAIVVWQPVRRHQPPRAGDHPYRRRPAGTFANEVTLSTPGQDAQRPGRRRRSQRGRERRGRLVPLRRHEAAGPVLPPPGRGRVPAADGSRSVAGFAGAGVQRVHGSPNRIHGPTAGVPVVQPAGRGLLPC